MHQTHWVDSFLVGVFYASHYQWTQQEMCSVKRGVKGEDNYGVLWNGHTLFPSLPIAPSSAFHIVSELP